MTEQPERRLTEIKDNILQCKKKHPLASERKIAKEVQCSAAYVHQVLKQYGINQGKLEEFKSNRADILDGIGMNMLAHIASKLEQKASEATLQQIVTSYGIIQDKSSAIRSPVDMSSKPMVTINMIGVKPADVIIDVTPESNK